MKHMSLDLASAYFCIPLYSHQADLYRPQIKGQATYRVSMILKQCLFSSLNIFRSFVFLGEVLLQSIFRVKLLIIKREFKLSSGKLAF